VKLNFKSEEKRIQIVMDYGAGRSANAGFDHVYELGLMNEPIHEDRAPSMTIMIHRALVV